MAAVPPIAQDYQNLLTTIVGLNVGQLNCVVAEGFTSLTRIRLANLTSKEIADWANRKSALQLNRGGCRWGIPAIKCFQALSFWITDSHRRGIVITPIDFTAAVLDEYLELVRVEMQTDETEDKTEAPGALKDSKWEDWNILFNNYLMAQTSVDGIPLFYVIRPDLPPGTTILGLPRDRQLLYGAPHTGPAFRRDNQKVFRIINSLTVSENATNWISDVIKRRQDGRAAMLALRAHYDGADGRYKRKTQATTALSVLHYSHEHSMPFSTFASRMKKAYDTLSVCDPPGISNRTQVEQLLDRIKTTNQMLLTCITAIRMDHVKYDTFDKAATELSTQIAGIFPKAGASGPGRHRKRQASDVHRGKGYKIIQKNGRELINGVDVTDRTREFPKVDWIKLPKGFRTILNRMPERRNHNKKLNGRTTSSVTTAGGSSETEASQFQLPDNVQAGLVTATARAVASLDRSSSVPPSTVQMPRMGAGNRRQAAAVANESASVISDVSTIRWDRDGNIIN